MRNVYRLLPLLLLLAACGKAPSIGACSSSPILGTWTDLGSGDRLTFGADCSAVSTRCSLTAVTSVYGSSSPQAVTFRVTSTNGLSNCLPIGDTACGLSFDSTTLGISCGGGSVTGSYNR